MSGLDAAVNSPGAGPAEHCTPAQAVHRDGTDQPAPMHTRDAPARIAVTQCQGPLSLQLLYHMSSVQHLTPACSTPRAAGAARGVPLLHLDSRSSSQPVTRRAHSLQSVHHQHA